MEFKLLSVTQSGKVDDLYSLIKAVPDILENADVLPFIHTPLHEASSNGKIDLAMELMILKPSFAKKLNEDGLSPLHLAVENKQVELALQLVKFDPSLVRIHGRGGMTPLHLVAKKGDVDLLTEFLVECPESIKDANVNGETVLHIAVMNNRYEELKSITGWMQKMRNSTAAFIEKHILNRRNRQGNTALHLAAYENNHRVVKQLLKCMSLNRNIKNNSGMTALDVIQANIDGSHDMSKNTEKIIQRAGGKTGESLSKVKTMSAFLRTPITFREYCSTGMARYRSRMSDGTRNALLVITALIITTTYQSATQNEDREKQEKQSWEQFILDTVLLWGFNTLAFCLSIVLTFILLPVGTAYTWWYIFITGPLICSYALSIYMKSRMYLSSPPSEYIYLYLMIILGFLVYLLVFYVRWKRTTQRKIPEPKSEMISQDFKTMV